MENQHRGLKFLVIFMGVLIILGVSVIAYTIISRLTAGGKSDSPETVTKAASQPAAVQGAHPKWKPRPLKAFGDVTAKIPAGAVIEEMTTDRRHLILRLRLVSGEQSVHIFNLRTGERLGSINLQAE
jgi:hypothetical protein